MDEQAEASLKAHMRTITVKGQRLRITIHAGNGTRTPLLLMAGIGSSLEMLQPFVDEVDPAIEVIRFDVPGTGGSPTPIFPQFLSALPPFVVPQFHPFGFRQGELRWLSSGAAPGPNFALP